MFKEMTHEEMLAVDGGISSEQYEKAAIATAGAILGTVVAPIGAPAVGAVAGLTYLATVEESEPSEPRDFDSNSLNSL